MRIRRWVVLVASLAVLGCQPSSTGSSATAVPAAAPRMPVGAASTPAPVSDASDEARLIVQAVRLRPPLPSGVTFGGILDTSVFEAQIATMDGDIRATWRVDKAAGEPNVLAAGAYRVSVWRYTVQDNVETGARTTSPPLDPCSIDLTLGGGTLVSVVARFPSGGGPCRIATAD
jgi:hypothetical protein